MRKGRLLYEGKAKKLYETDDEQLVWVEYCDNATALNGKRKEEIKGKGALNNQITSLIFQKLNSEQIQTSFIKQLSKAEQLNRKVQIIPLEVVLRNRVAGSFAKRFGLEEGDILLNPLLNFITSLTYWTIHLSMMHMSIFLNLLAQKKWNSSNQRH